MAIAELASTAGLARTQSPSMVAVAISHRRARAPQREEAWHGAEHRRSASRHSVRRGLSRATWEHDAAQRAAEVQARHEEVQRGTEARTRWEEAQRAAEAKTQREKA